MSRKFWILLALVAMIWLTGCNMPGREAAPSSEDALATAAQMTVEARLTEMAAASVSPEEATSAPGAITDTPSPTVAQAPPTDTPQPPPTQPPPAQPPTNTPIPCNWAQFVSDVTYPDGTDVITGTGFVKTWRLRNIGSCPWTSGYRLIFSHGDRMGAPDAVQLTGGVVNPGQTVDVSVNLVAPDTPGVYQGFFMLRSSDNVVFGLGDSADKPFWVKVEVFPPDTPTWTPTPTFTPTTPPAGPVSVTLNPVAGGSGTVYDPPQGVPNTVLAGDTAANAQARGYLSYDISAMSGATIVSATLNVNCNAVGNPFGNLNGIWLGVVEYALPLDQPDFNVGSTPITKITSLPVGAQDVSSWVQAKASAGAPYFQVRFHPVTFTNNDGQADYVMCSNTTLSVTYQP